MIKNPRNITRDQKILVNKFKFNLYVPTLPTLVEHITLHLGNSTQKLSEFKMSSYQTPLGWHTEFLEGLLSSSQVPVLRQEPVGGGGEGRSKTQLPLPHCLLNNDIVPSVINHLNTPAPVPSTQPQTKEDTQNLLAVNQDLKNNPLG